MLLVMLSPSPHANIGPCKSPKKNHRRLQQARDLGQIMSFIKSRHFVPKHIMLGHCTLVTKQKQMWTKKKKTSENFTNYKFFKRREHTSNNQLQRKCGTRKFLFKLCLKTFMLSRNLKYYEDFTAKRVLSKSKIILYR